MDEKLLKLSEEFKKIERRWQIGKTVLEDNRGLCASDVKDVLKKAREMLAKKSEITSSHLPDEAKEQEFLRENEQLKKEVESLRMKLEELNNEAKEFAIWRKEFAIELLKKDDVIARQEETIASLKEQLKKYEEDIRNLNVKIASYRLPRTESKGLLKKLTLWLRREMLAIKW